MPSTERETKEKIHLTLAPEIKTIGFEDADKWGMSFSAYVSMLIANSHKKKNQKGD